MKENREKIIEMKQWSAREYAATPPQDFTKMYHDFHAKANEKLEKEWFITCFHAKKADILNLVRESMKTEFCMQDEIKRGLFVPQPSRESKDTLGKFILLF